MSGARDPAAALYIGKVMHARLKPVGHRFSYRVMSLLIDLDRLDDANRQSSLFGVDRASLYSFYQCDHGPRDGADLRAYVDEQARAHGVDLTGGRVRLLCYPRVVGYVFNPLSVFFCEDASGRLALMIYEVRNTFGEMRSYVLPVAQDAVSEAGIRQSQDKDFYVSPFIEMPMRYHFRVVPPADIVNVRILETDAEGPLLSATFHGERRALTTAALLSAFATLPLVSFKIIAAIHWEALRLWLKGVRLVPRAPSAERTRFAAPLHDAYTHPAQATGGPEPTKPTLHR